MATTRLPPAPRWAVTCAHVAALTPLPSGLWRVLLAVGVPVGYSAGEARALFDAPGWGSVYLVGLSVLLEGLGLLTLGLVRPWGERVPTWVPRRGGRPLRGRRVATAALVGAVLLTLVWVPTAVLWWVVPGDGALTGPARVWVGLLYVPLALWGPLLGLVAWDLRARSAGTA
ncbi:hypothetical protein [Phycicoccus sonneratiae]|uniref:Uncharacterized protein n=1 Tax=Phycicoccus sonneratiae TaxID=2807628 RepID=A0ABS2CNF5_9MICO|nr:hypothetical protein [Phycicoccus sonneraticus]MBM6401412.1 hypothetical protein [Phycicoccus sonneraticus]